jgi:hypothetical protein
MYKQNTMPLVQPNLTLSEAKDHGNNGKMVRFYCFSATKYVEEKHTHDHEEFMRIQDAKLIGTLLFLIDGEVRKLADKGQFKSVNINDALTVYKACMRALSEYGGQGEQFRGMIPYSKEILYAVAGYLRLILPELNMINAIDATRSGTKVYKQLLHLANLLEHRYAPEVYNPLVARKQTA